MEEKKTLIQRGEKKQSKRRTKQEEARREAICRWRKLLLLVSDFYLPGESSPPGCSIYLAAHSWLYLARPRARVFYSILPWFPPLSLSLCNRTSFIFEVKIVVDKQSFSITLLRYQVDLRLIHLYRDGIFIPADFLNFPYFSSTSCLRFLSFVSQVVSPYHRATARSNRKLIRISRERRRKGGPLGKLPSCGVNVAFFPSSTSLACISFDLSHLAQKRVSRNLTKFRDTRFCPNPQNSRRFLCI